MISSYLFIATFNCKLRVGPGIRERYQLCHVVLYLIDVLVNQSCNLLTCRAETTTHMKTAMWQMLNLHPRISSLRMEMQPQCQTLVCHHGTQQDVLQWHQLITIAHRGFIVVSKTARFLYFSTNLKRWYEPVVFLYTNNLACASLQRRSCQWTRTTANFTNKVSSQVSSSSNNFICKIFSKREGLNAKTTW